MGVWPESQQKSYLEVEPYTGKLLTTRVFRANGLARNRPGLGAFRLLSLPGRHPVSLTTRGYQPTLHEGGGIVKDIYEVLRKKQAEQAQLGKQIEALQTAAEQLRSVAHLLNEEEAHGEGAANGG